MFLLLLFTFIVSVYSNPFAQTIQRQACATMSPRLCKNCIYFEPVLFKGDTYFGEHLGKCTKFTQTNPITGETDYMLAMEARRSFKYCGKWGLFYVENPPQRQNKIDM